ncbi:MAG: hypothetical protein QTN59_02625 [Candidatus Electrothrix communis]|nr:hypothetical protein [Desulfobulbus sp. US4]WLE97738.1 MAG: hypothetical protein QTN59_02625 [Candidatus Electrothrix communis]
MKNNVDRSYASDNKNQESYRCQPANDHANYRIINSLQKLFHFELSVFFTY